MDTLYKEKVGNICTSFVDKEKLIIDKELPRLSAITKDYIEHGTMIDSLKCTISFPFTIPVEQLSDFRSYALGILKSDSPKFVNKVGCKIEFKIGRHQESDDHFSSYLKITLNPIKLVRELISDNKKVSSIDEASNYLVNTNYYWNGKYSTFNLISLLESITEESNRFITELASKDSSKAIIDIVKKLKIKPYVKHLEFCVHVESDQRSNQDMMKIYNFLEKNYSVMSIGRYGVSKIVKSIKAEIDKGLFLSCYYKTVNVLKIELRIESDYIKEFYKNYGWHDIEDFINLHHSDAIRLFQDVLLSEVSYSDGLDATECEKELRATIKPKFFTILIRKVLEGDGKIKVTSKNQSLYKEVRRLAKEGIFIKENTQSVYSINHKFKKLVLEDGITRRTFRDL